MVHGTSQVSTTYSNINSCYCHFRTDIRWVHDGIDMRKWKMWWPNWESRFDEQFGEWLGVENSNKMCSFASELYSFCDIVSYCASVYLLLWSTFYALNEQPNQQTQRRCVDHCKLNIIDAVWWKLLQFLCVFVVFNLVVLVLRNTSVWDCPSDQWD